MEDANDDETTALFVEAFGDRERFFNVCLKELDKSVAIIEAHIDRTNLDKVTQYRGEEEEDLEEEIPENQEDRI